MSGYRNKAGSSDSLTGLSVSESGSLSNESHTEMDDEEEMAIKQLKAQALSKKCQNDKFRKTDEFDLEYHAGEEVIPSADQKHREKKAVVFGKRTKDLGINGPHGESVIIKWRHKELSFKDTQEDREWVRHMRYLHRLTYLDGKEAPVKVRSHLARLPDIIEDSKYYYIIMEHVKGRDLFDWFVQERIHERSYKVPIAREMAIQILLGLEQLHDAGMIHRDLKLENIVIDERKVKQQGLKTLQCDLKIIDYDTVVVYNPSVKAFHVLGTDQYIAPESYIGQSSPASDMWALGVCIYVIITGTFPFHCALFDDQPGENYVGHVKMDTIRRRLRLARIDWGGSCWKDQPLAKDFCRRCFHCDERRRLSVKQAFEHKWIVEGRLERAQMDEQARIEKEARRAEKKKLSQSPSSQRLGGFGSTGSTAVR